MLLVVGMMMFSPFFVSSRRSRPKLRGLELLVLLVVVRPYSFSGADAVVSSLSAPSF